VTSIAPLVLAAAMAQAAAAPQEDPAVIPQGTPADQQLWRALRDAANSATVAMGRIAQCSFRIEYGKYYEGLDEALASGTEAERTEARPLRERLAAEAKAAEAAMPEKPGIRECQYVLRDLGLYMPNLSEPAAKKAIPAARKQAEGCVKRLAPLAETLTARAGALEAAVDAADALQARRLASAAASADGKAPAAAPEPTGAPAPAAPAKEAKP
jgi:hypothetical protein